MSDDPGPVLAVIHHHYELAARLHGGSGEMSEQRFLGMVREGRQNELSPADLMARLTDGDAETAHWLHAVLLERKPREKRASTLETCRRTPETPDP